MRSKMKDNKFYDNYTIYYLKDDIIYEMVN